MPAKAGDDPITGDGHAPGTAEWADAQTLLNGFLQSLVQADSIQGQLDGERKFNFQQEFPKADFCPSPCWEVDRLFTSSLSLQLNHLARYSEQTQFLLRTVYKKTTLIRRDGKPGYWNNKSDWERYDARACLIATSAYEQRLAFCLCGVPRRDRKHSGCQDISFCPRCNFHRRLKPMRKEFGQSFTAAPEVLLITLSIGKGDSPEPRLKFEDLTDEVWAENVIADGIVRPSTSGIDTYSGSPDFEGCQAIFGAVRGTLGAAVDSGILTGYYGAPELAVGFLPLRILPHGHAVAFSNGFTLAKAQAVLRAFEKRLCLLRNTGVIPKSVVADVQILRVPTKKDYLKVLSYCFKPLKVERAFQFAAETRVGEDLAQMARLSSDVEEFFEIIEMVFSGVHRVMRKGICAPKSAAYCGRVTRERQCKRRKEKARRLKRKKAQEEMSKMMEP